MTTETEAEPEVEVAPVSAEALELEFAFDEAVACSVQERWTCFRCGFTVEPCDKEAEWLCVKGCGCRRPLCAGCKERYSAHFMGCATLHLPARWRCNWCKRQMNPHDFHYVAI